MENIENFNQEIIEATGTPRVEVSVVEEKEGETVDFYQPRTVVLTREIKGKTVEFTHQTARLSNKIWLDFNDILNARQEFNGKKLQYRDNSEKAVRDTYKILVKEIPHGYQSFFKQQLTQENFYDLIPLNDQQTVINEVFANDVSENEEAEFYFDSNQRVEFDVDVPINGELVTGKLFLNEKTKKDENDYNKANEPNAGKVKRFRNLNYSLKPDFASLEKLSTKIIAATGVFQDNDVPIWLRISALNYYFNIYGKSETKN